MTVDRPFISILPLPWQKGEKKMNRKGYGKKDGSQKGRKEGGQGRNRTSKCRHPAIKKSRKK